MNWTVEYARGVKKSVTKFDCQTQEKLRRFIEGRLADLENPRQLGLAMQGSKSGLWRYRVCDYRIIADIDDDRIPILVVRIGHCREVHRD